MPEACTPPARVTEDDLEHTFARIELGVRTLRRISMHHYRQDARTSWPDVIHEHSDIWHATLTHEATPPRIAPSPQQISNMDEVIGWMAWLTANTGKQTSKALWLVAMGMSYRRVSRMIGVRSHHTVKSWVESALYLIAVNFIKK